MVCLYGLSFMSYDELGVQKSNQYIALLYTYLLLYTIYTVILYSVMYNVVVSEYYVLYTV